MRNTWKVPAKLVEQLSVCKYDLDVIEHAFEYGVKKALDLNYDFIKSGGENELQGKYTMLIGRTDQYGRGIVDIERKDPRRKKLKLSGNSKLKIAIKKFAMDQT